MKIKSTIMAFLMVCSVLIFNACDDTGGNNKTKLLILLALGSGHSTTASRVYGQGGSFTANSSNNGGISATSLYAAQSVAADGSGNLYVADTSNNRVLYYASGSTTATRVYGQGGVYTTNTQNKGGISSTSLNQPTGVALDASGNLYVADFGNNRVLYYASGSTEATRVYGQGGVYTTATQNKGGISEISLYQPGTVVVDGSGNVYVADTYNNRVLYYASGSTTATRVYGQGGSFASNTANNGGITANSLIRPAGVAVDPSGNLYVADALNNRLLYYASGSTTATRVYGQSNYTTNTANTGGISAISLDTPEGIALDSGGGLYVADSNNHRVLYYAPASTTATRVYGQGGSFTTNISNNGGVSANSLWGASGVALDIGGHLYVADFWNNRVLYFN